MTFKAKNVRDRDERDLQQALPVLSAQERAWLRDAIALVHPGHPWNAPLGPAQN